MKILVTGGAGFIGSHLVDRLIKEGHDVSVIDNLSTGSKENLNSKARFYDLDIQSPDVYDVFEKENPDVLFHFAAQINVRKSVADPVFDAKQNILGSLNLFEAFKESSQGKGKIIFSSTGGAIYGDADVVPTPETFSAEPVSPYGIAKLSTEKYLNFFYQVHGMPFTALRFANVFGPRQNSKGEAGVVAIFCEKALEEEDLTVFGDGEQTRDFVFVDDVVNSAMLAMESEEVGVFNVGTGIETSVNEIFEMIKKAGDFDVEKKHLDAVAGELQRSVLDHSKISKALGWKPEVSAEEGIKKTVKGFNKKKAKSDTLIAQQGKNFVG